MRDDPAERLWSKGGLRGLIKAWLTDICIRVYKNADNWFHLIKSPRDGYRNDRKNLKKTPSIEVPRSMSRNSRFFPAGCPDDHFQYGDPLGGAFELGRLPTRIASAFSVSFISDSLQPLFWKDHGRHRPPFDLSVHRTDGFYLRLFRHYEDGDLNDASTRSLTSPFIGAITDGKTIS